MTAKILGRVDIKTFEKYLVTSPHMVSHTLLDSHSLRLALNNQRHGMNESKVLMFQS